MRRHRQPHPPPTRSAKVGTALVGLLVMGFIWWANAATASCSHVNDGPDPQAAGWYYLCS